MREPLALGPKITPIWLKIAQNSPQRPPLVQNCHTISHCTRFWAIQVILGSQSCEKQALNRLKTGPSAPALWALKSLQYGPKQPKIAPKGPHQYSMVKLCPTVPDLGPFKSFLVAKQLGNRLQTGPSLLLWALKTFVSSNGSNSGNFGTFWNL